MVDYDNLTISATCILLSFCQKRLIILSSHLKPSGTKKLPNKVVKRALPNGVTLRFNEIMTRLIFFSFLFRLSQ